MTRALPLLLALALSPRLAAPARAQAEDRDLQRRITPVVQVVREARPSVVFIQSNGAGEVVQDFWGRIRQIPTAITGSGVVIFEDGYIVTNNHVVDGATKIQVSFDQADDPRAYDAQIISQDSRNDLALIKIDGDRPFPALRLGSNDPLLGESVIAIGNPYGQTHTVSTGIVSGLHRNVKVPPRDGRGPVLEFTNLIQTDAAINAGNSGGPLLNINGELIGINAVVNAVAENIGFAIPVDHVRHVLNDHLLSLDRARAWLGFDLDPERFVVREVTPGGPAALAGLRIGDRLESLAGKPLTNAETYRLTRLAVQPLDEVPLEITRDRRREKLVVQAWNGLDGYLFERLGVSVEPTLLSPGMRRYLRVTEVQPTGPSAALQPGDILDAVQVEGTPLKRLAAKDELMWVLSTLPPQSRIKLFILRDDDADGQYELRGANWERYSGEITLR
ncbi:MAG: trypsin-like peptidase domain-containing protein [Planctomycetota bacterium]